MSEVRSQPAGFTRWIVTLPPTIFLLCFFLLPALIVVFAGFRETGEFGGLAPIDTFSALTLDSYRFLLGDVIYLEIFLRSFLVAGLVYVHLPFMILPLYTNLEKHDPALLEAAQDLGEMCIRDRPYAPWVTR